MEKKIIKSILLAILIAVGLELTIFNIKFYRSLFYPKTVKYSINKGIDKNVMFSNNVKINFLDNYDVELQDINQKVYNIYFDVDASEPSTFTIKFKDDGNADYYKAGEVTIVNDVPQTKYFSIHPMGKLQSLKIESNTTVDIYVKDVYINARVPFQFNIIRVLLVLTLLGIYLLLKVMKPFEKSYQNYLPFTMVLVVLITNGFYIFINLSNYGKFTYDYDEVNQHFQYQLLARSLAKGQLTIDLPVSQKLLDLDNPYDTLIRDRYLNVNSDYYLDYAFYKGKYYSYFGIVPCLFMHLPYYLITHHDFNNCFAMLFSCIFYVIAGFYLTYQVFNRYFKKAKYNEYLLCAISVSLLSGISLVVRKGFFYGIPIAFGAALAMMGLAFWLKATRDEKKLNVKYLLLGSICLALVPGCRPQIFASVFLAIPIFIKYFKNKEIFKVKNILAICLPMLIVAGLLMYYNYVRFDSILDFGAHYNLTSNDMNNRGFYFDRLISGTFAFLFELPRFNLVFPYIHPYVIDNNYLGITIYEEMAGGIIVINLLSFINLFVFKLKNYLKNKEAFYFCLLAIIISLIVIFADVQMAGILPRYMCDFGFMLSISAVILWMTMLHNCPVNKELVFKIIMWLVIIGLVYNFLVFFTDGLYPYNYNIYKKIFIYFYHMFSFGV